MMLLRLVSWPYLRQHPLRTALTVLGIVLGASVFVAMQAVNGAVLDGLRRTVDRVAGKAQLQITAGDGGFPEQILEQVQAQPAVRVAVPVIEVPIETGLQGQGNLLILGVDMTGDQSLREYDLKAATDAVVDDPLVFLAQPDSLIVTDGFARQNGLDVNSRLALGTMTGRREFTVRGILSPDGLGSAFGGNLAVMDVYAAQHMFGRGRVFDRIDVMLADGVDLSEGEAALQRALGPGFNVEAPSSRGAHFDDLLRVYSISMTVSSIFALFIGMFIIYNFLMIGVGQRRKEIAILRTLGATRRQLYVLFLIESALAGVVGSAIGCIAGLFMGRAIVGQIGGMLEGVYGLVQQPEEIALTPALMALAMTAGVVTSVVAALIPTYQAANVEPIENLQKGRDRGESRGSNRLRWWSAVASATGAVGCYLLGRTSGFFYPGYALTIAAALLFAPWLTSAVASFLRRPLGWVRPVEGVLAVDSLLQAPRRTSGTIAALMLALAEVIGIAGMSTGMYGNISDWVTTTLNPDLWVTSSRSLSNRTYRFPSSMTAELQGMEDVAEVQQVRNERIRFRGSSALLISIEVDGLHRRAPGGAVSGDPEQMYRLAAEGKGALVSENLANLQRVRIGDVLDIPTPSGVLQLPVIGVIRDWSDQLGSIVIDRHVFVEWWRDDSVNMFRLYLAPGAAEDAVKARILARYADSKHLFVLNNRDVRAYIMGLAEQWVSLTNSQIFVAVLVAVLGIANALTVSIIDRRRELGILQAVGGLHRQIRQTIWIEAMSIAAIGLVLGFALGAINLQYVLNILRRDVGGLSIDYTYPVRLALVMIPVILVAAVVSAIGPGESVIRGTLARSLEYE